MDNVFIPWAYAQLKQEAPHVLLSPVVSIGIVDDGGNILGAVLYHDFVGENIQMSIATVDKNWCNRRNLHTFFAYPFLRLKVLRITASC